MASNLHCSSGAILSFSYSRLGCGVPAGTLEAEVRSRGEVFMNKLLWVFLVLPLAIACALAQTANGTGSSEVQNTNQSPQNTPSTKAGASTQKGTAGVSQDKSSASVPASAADASRGGIAGAAGSTAGNVQIPETPQTPSAATAPSDSDLQAQVQNSLSKEPTLSGDSVNVAVSADSIEITGTVTTAREKQTATRIVQSYAGNKKVNSHLTVTGRNRSASPPAASPKGTREDNSSGTGDVSAHPEPNKGAAPRSSTRPPG